MKRHPQVSPSLHPDMVKVIKGYDVDNASLKPIRLLLEKTYRLLGSVYTFRESATTNPGWTHAKKIVETANYANKQKAELLPKFEELHSRLASGVREIEEKLSAPLEATENGGTLHGEIRAYFKSLESAGTRNDQLNAAIESGDTLTVNAVLGAPAYLSGLTEKHREHYSQLYRRASNPEKNTEIEMKSSAADFVQSCGALLVAECEKAIGEKPQEVQRLRAELGSHA